MLLKNPVAPPGIDPGTLRLVAQRLEHYAIPGPVLYYRIIKLHVNNNGWVDVVPVANQYGVNGLGFGYR
jgi:hypothetical protein